MYLFLVFLVFAIFGYLIASSRYSKQIDSTASTIVEAPRNWYHRLRHRGQKSLPAGSPTYPFIPWASGEGAGYFPEDFRSWLTGLTPTEADRVMPAMDRYAQGLGFRLDDLMQADLQAKPALMQVYVETLTIYSQAYRRARQAQQEAEKSRGGKPVPVNPAEGSNSPGKKDSKTSREAAENTEPVLVPAA